MKSTTFYRLLLGLPYLFLIPGFFIMRDYFRPLATGVPNASSSNIFEFIVAFWGITGIFWIIPYTFFAIGLLLWSIGKSKETIRTWFTRSPFVLMMLSPFFYLLISPFQGALTDKDVAGTFGAYICIGAACSMPLSLIFGFIFVGIGLLFHSILTSMGFIKDELSIT